MNRHLPLVRLSLLFEDEEAFSMSRKLNRIFLSVLVISAAVSARTESHTGVLYPAELVYLNGTEIDSSHGLMAGDVIHTRERGTATLQFAGAIALFPQIRW